MPKKNFLIFLSLIVTGLAFIVIYSGSFDGPAGRNFDIRKLTGKIEENEKTAIYEGEKIAIPDIAIANTPQNKNVLGVSTAERWIDVDLSEQKIRAWEGNTLFLEAPISSGLPRSPTPKGEFRIMYKVRATRMEGGEGKYYYNLPNVPFVMFFGNDKISWGTGYSLHGAYWHNDFGTVHSHGCVNLQIPIAEKLYYWTFPIIPEGKNYIRADDSNPGTRIVIHD